MMCTGTGRQHRTCNMHTQMTFFTACRPTQTNNIMQRLILEGTLRALIDLHNTIKLMQNAIFKKFNQVQYMHQ